MSKKILIVDDDADIRMGLDARLRASGYDTVFAADGADATRKAMKERPDLILLDLGLPAGDGFVVLERIRNRPDLAAIPVIVLSARDPEHNEKKALDAGARAFYQKPVEADVLLEGIESAFRLHGHTIG
ncbi:MAG: response regulator [bacterium]|nr:response regulator [bacterium]